MKNKIKISVEVSYLEEHSDSDNARFMFSYTITITNLGEAGARLLTRHWVITDENGKTEEVAGDGVVGQQPYIKPGASYRYTSGAMIQTETGTMKGSYGMINDDEEYFDTIIPAFILTIPRTLH